MINSDLDILKLIKEKSKDKEFLKSKSINDLEDYFKKIKKVDLNSKNKLNVQEKKNFDIFSNNLTNELDSKKEVQLFQNKYKKFLNKIFISEIESFKDSRLNSIINEINELEAKYSAFKNVRVRQLIGNINNYLISKEDLLNEKSHRNDADTLLALFPSVKLMTLENINNYEEEFLASSERVKSIIISKNKGLVVLNLLKEVISKRKQIQILVDDLTTLKGSFNSDLSTKFTSIEQKFTTLSNSIPADLSTKFNTLEDDVSTLKRTFNADFIAKITSIKQQITDLASVDSVSSLSDKISSIKSKLKTLSQKIPDLSTKFNTLEDDVSTLKRTFNADFIAKITSIEEQIPDLASIDSVSSLSVEFNTLKTDFSALKGSFNSDLSTKFNSIETKFSTLSESIPADLSDEFNKLQTNFSTLKGSFNSDLATEFTSIEQQIADLASADSVSSLSDKIISFKGKLKTLSQKIPDLSTKLNKLKTNFSTLKGSFNSDLTTKFNSIETKFTNLNNSIPSNLVTEFNTLKTDFSTLKGSFNSNLTTQFNSIERKITDLASVDSVSSLSDEFNTLKTDFSALKGSFNSDLTTQFTSIETKFTTLSNSIPTDLSDEFNTLKTDFVTLKGSFDSNLTNGLDSIENKFNLLKKDFSTNFLSEVKKISDKLIGLKNIVKSDSEIENDEDNIISNENSINNFVEVKTLLENLETNLNYLKNNFFPENESDIFNLTVDSFTNWRVITTSDHNYQILNSWNIPFINDRKALTELQLQNAERNLNDIPGYQKALNDLTLKNRSIAQYDNFENWQAVLDESYEVTIQNINEEAGFSNLSIDEADYQLKLQDLNKSLNDIPGYLNAKLKNDNKKLSVLRFGDISDWNAISSNNLDIFIKTNKVENNIEISTSLATIELNNQHASAELDSIRGYAVAKNKFDIKEQSILEHGNYLEWNTNILEDYNYQFVDSKDNIFANEADLMNELRKQKQDATLSDIPNYKYAQYKKDRKNLSIERHGPYTEWTLLNDLNNIASISIVRDGKGLIFPDAKSFKVELLKQIQYKHINNVFPNYETVLNRLTEINHSISNHGEYKNWNTVILEDFKYKIVDIYGRSFVNDDAALYKLRIQNSNLSNLNNISNYSEAIASKTKKETSIRNHGEYTQWKAINDDNFDLKILDFNRQEISKKTAITELKKQNKNSELTDISNYGTAFINESLKQYSIESKGLYTYWKAIPTDSGYPEFNISDRYSNVFASEDEALLELQKQKKEIESLEIISDYINLKKQRDEYNDSVTKYGNLNNINLEDGGNTITTEFVPLSHSIFYVLKNSSNEVIRNFNSEQFAIELKKQNIIFENIKNLIINYDVAMTECRKVSSIQKWGRIVEPITGDMISDKLTIRETDTNSDQFKFYIVNDPSHPESNNSFRSIGNLEELNGIILDQGGNAIDFLNIKDFIPDFENSLFFKKYFLNAAIYERILPELQSIYLDLPAFSWRLITNDIQDHNEYLIYNLDTSGILPPHKEIIISGTDLKKIFLNNHLKLSKNKKQIILKNISKRSVIELQGVSENEILNIPGSVVLEPKINSLFNDDHIIEPLFKESSIINIPLKKKKIDADGNIFFETKYKKMLKIDLVEDFDLTRTYNFKLNYFPTIKDNLHDSNESVEGKDPVETHRATFDFSLFPSYTSEFNENASGEELDNLINWNFPKVEGQKNLNIGEVWSSKSRAQEKECNNGHDGTDPCQIHNEDAKSNRIKGRFVAFVLDRTDQDSINQWKLMNGKMNFNTIHSNLAESNQPIYQLKTESLELFVSPQKDKFFPRHPEPKLVKSTFKSDKPFKSLYIYFGESPEGVNDFPVAGSTFEMFLEDQ